MNILILGVGNVLLGDEGAGVRAVEELARRYILPEGVELLDGGTAGLELLRHIEARDLLIIIDAVRSGRPAGTVVRVEKEDLPATFQARISPHQLGLSDVLAAGAISDELPRRIVLFGIEPRCVETGLALSAEVEQGFEKLLGAVIDELHSCGCAVTRREVDLSLGLGLWEPAHRRGEPFAIWASPAETAGAKP